MPHVDTVLAQTLKLVPRHDFDSLAKTHHCGGDLRRMSRWSQFVAMAVGHISRRPSLRDAVGTLQAQGPRLYHLGVRPVARSSLARVNAEQPYKLYEALFAKLVTRCQALAPRHGFRFKNKLYSIDASLIDLSLKIFPWSKYALGKGAMKLHLGLDHDGFIPAFAVVTESRVMETTIARQLTLPKGSIAVFDRGYSEFAWFKNLDDTGVFFVTRRRANTLYEVAEELGPSTADGIVSDQIVRFTGAKAIKSGMPELRLVTFDCPDTGKRYEFLTNIRHLAAATIAAIYKSRWQIELFFKFLKQNLKLKGFYGTSKNAVLTQIWIALCVTLMIAYLKFSSAIGLSLQQMLRHIETNLFLRRDLLALLRGKPPDPSHRHPNQGVLAL
ncbi:MAG: IS4 family transposase [Burkholderiales bacterium]